MFNIYVHFWWKEEGIRFFCSNSSSHLPILDYNNAIIIIIFVQKLCYIFHSMIVIIIGWFLQCCVRKWIERSVPFSSISSSLSCSIFADDAEVRGPEEPFRGAFSRAAAKDGKEAKGEKSFSNPSLKIIITAKMLNMSSLSLSFHLSPKPYSKELRCFCNSHHCRMCRGSIMYTIFNPLSV